MPTFYTNDGLIHCADTLLSTLSAEAQAGYIAKPWGGVETGGLLLGNREPDGVAISDRIIVDCEHQFGPAFELSDADRQKLVESLPQIQAQNRARDIVGWYRTTSKYLSMTEADIALADQFFDGPWQLTVIIQRARNQKPLFGIFRKQPDGVWNCTADFREEDALQPATEGPEPVCPILSTVTDSQQAVDTVSEPPPVPGFRGCDPIYPGLFDREPYLERLGLHENPFGATPDPRYWYPSPKHREAAAAILYGAQARKACIVLTGEAGTGKTLVLEYVADALKAAGIDFGLLLNSRVTVEEFFELIARDLELPLKSYRKVQVLIALQDRLIRAAQRGSTVVILIDDAHKLSNEVLEEIDLLGNFESRQGKLLQVVLAGQPELDAKLNSPSLRSLKQRITVRATLAPLCQTETASYIRARLKQAGASDLSLFSEPITDAIWKSTSGIPRLINSVCSALLARLSSSETIMTSELVAEVARENG